MRLHRDCVEIAHLAPGILEAPPNVGSDTGSVESVLSRWGDSLEMSRADEMGRRGQRWRTWVKQVLPGPEL